MSNQIFFNPIVHCTFTRNCTSALIKNYETQISTLQLLAKELEHFIRRALYCFSQVHYTVFEDKEEQRCDTHFKKVCWYVSSTKNSTGYLSIEYILFLEKNKKFIQHYYQVEFCILKQKGAYYRGSPLYTNSLIQ